MNKQKHQIVSTVKDAYYCGDLIILFPQYDITFAGDLVFDGRVSALFDNNMNYWILNLKFLDGIHEKDGDEKSEMVLKYLTDIKERILFAIENDYGVDTLGKIVTLPGNKELKISMTIYRQDSIGDYESMELSYA